MTLLCSPQILSSIQAGGICMCLMFITNSSHNPFAKLTQCLLDKSGNLCNTWLRLILIADCSMIDWLFGCLTKLFNHQDDNEWRWGEYYKGFFAFKPLSSGLYRHVVLMFVTNVSEERTDLFTLKMETIRSAETFSTFHKTTWSYNPDYHKKRLHRPENFKIQFL